VNNSNGIIAAHGAIFGFGLFEYVCEAFADSFMRFFWDFGFQTSSPLFSMVLFDHIPIVCIFHIFIVLYESESRYINGLTINLGCPNIPAFTPVFMDQKRANSGMLHV